MSENDIKPRKRTPVAIALICIAGLMVILLALWAMCIIADYLGNPQSDTNASPDYAHSYDLINNGTIDNIVIESDFTSLLRNDVRYIETTGNSIEVKLWGRYLNSTVKFNKNDTRLNVNIDIQTYSSNDFGAEHANEYIYLPKNWSYMIISNNRYGNTIVENKSWNYTAIDN